MAAMSSSVPTARGESVFMARGSLSALKRWSAWRDRPPPGAGPRRRTGHSRCSI